MLDLNNAEECGVKEFKVFNNGNAGVVTGCTIRVEKKKDNSNQPDYKVFVSDGTGEVNEGFYYSDDVEKFKKYQAQRLINLAKGVLGADYKFPAYKTPQEALDGTMMEINKSGVGSFRAVVAYGTAAKPEAWLRFPAWGKFIQNEVFANELVLKKDALLAPVAPDKEDDNPFTSMDNATSGDPDW
jgi:hypothetical protein